jgi:hypothetical protein
MAASHYHVAKWAQAGGYAYSDPAQADMVARLQAGLETIRASGTPLTRSQQSWVCVLQSLRPVDLVPSGFLMSGTASGVAGQQEHIEQVQSEQRCCAGPRTTSMTSVSGSISRFRRKLKGSFPISASGQNFFSSHKSKENEERTCLWGMTSLNAPEIKKTLTFWDN